MVLKVIHKVDAMISKAQQVFTAILLIAMTAVVLLQIILRYFFSFPTPWAEEIARILMIWIVLIGAAGMMIQGEHLCVDVFYRHFSVSVKKVIRVVYDVAILIFAGFVMWHSCRLLMNPVIYKSYTPIARLPLILYYLGLPISMGGIAIFEIGDIIEGVMDLRGPAHDQKGEGK